MRLRRSMQLFAGRTRARALSGLGRFEVTFPPTPQNRPAIEQPKRFAITGALEPAENLEPGTLNFELRIDVQMIAQRLGRSITDANKEQLFDEGLIDELEKKVFKNFRTK